MLYSARSSMGVWRKQEDCRDEVAYVLLIRNSVRMKRAENAGFGLVLFLDGWVAVTGTEEQENIIRKHHELEK